MTKAELRRSIQQMNKSIDNYARCDSSQRILAQIEQSAIFATSHTIALFVALRDEVDTLDYINRWRSMGKLILLPRVTSDERMEFYPYNGCEALSSGRWGILEPHNDVEPYEPRKIDLMILPAVALTRDGRRLGRGRGYYDRYLAREGFAAYTIGVCLPHQMVDEIPCEEYDKRLDAVLSGEEEILEANKTSLPSIILSMIEEAGVDATRLRCGVDVLNKMGLSWVLLHIAIEIYRAPEEGEKIEIETWINDCNRVSSTRNFTLRNSRGDVIGEASTQWCMIDLNARRAVNLMDAKINYAQHIQSRPATISIERRLPSIDVEQPILTAQHIASDRDIDFNNHVNTIRYIEMMIEQLPADLQCRVAPTRVDIHFASESKLGDQLSIKQQKRPLPNGEQSLFEISRHDGTTSVKALFTYPD